MILFSLFPKWTRIRRKFKKCIKEKKIILLAYKCVQFYFILHDENKAWSNNNTKSNRPRHVGIFHFAHSWWVRDLDNLYVFFNDFSWFFSSSSFCRHHMTFLLSCKLICINYGRWTFDSLLLSSSYVHRKLILEFREFWFDCSVNNKHIWKSYEAFVQFVAYQNLLTNHLDFYHDSTRYYR